MSLMVREEGRGEPFMIMQMSDTQQTQSLSRTGIFHVLFTSFFSTLAILTLQTLILSSNLHSFQPFRLLTMFTDKMKMRPVSKQDETQVL